MMKYCIPVIPSSDLQKSLHFWVEGVGLTADQHMWQDEKLVGCMVHNDHLYFWLNQRAGERTPEGFDGIRLYWTPDDINTARERLIETGFEVSELEERDYGQTEFFVTDDDGYSHCFGVPTRA